MSYLLISRILYAIAIISGFVSGFYLAYITIPIVTSAVIGLFAGYFQEKYKMEIQYDEPFFFRLHRLDIWGAVRAVFFSLVAYQLASFI